MYKLIVKPFAEEDAAKAAVWYNDKSEGLGNEFILALDAKINEIQRNPNHFQVVYKNIRKTLTNRFPYGIFFIVESNSIYILAILHTSRNPKIWKDR